MNSDMNWLDWKHVCVFIWKGHSRQGWKCRLCKINVHADCKSGVGRCLPKSRLLRRQKSSSELETTSQRILAANYEAQYQPSGGHQQGEDDMVDDGPTADVDQTYIVLKQASEMAASSSSTNISGRRMPPPLGLSGTDQPNVSSSDQSLTSSTGAISRTTGVMRITTSSSQSQQQGQSSLTPSLRRTNPNSLSVGEPASFLSSNSGKLAIILSTRLACLFLIGSIVNTEEDQSKGHQKEKEKLNFDSFFSFNLCWSRPIQSRLGWSGISWPNGLFDSSDVTFRPTGWFGGANDTFLPLQSVCQRLGSVNIRTVGDSFGSRGILKVELVVLFQLLMLLESRMMHQRLLLYLMWPSWVVERKKRNFLQSKLGVSD